MLRGRGPQRGPQPGRVFRGSPPGLDADYAILANGVYSVQSVYGPWAYAQFVPGDEDVYVPHVHDDDTYTANRYQAWGYVPPALDDDALAVAPAEDDLYTPNRYQGWSYVAPSLDDDVFTAIPPAFDDEQFTVWVPPGYRYVPPSWDDEAASFIGKSDPAYTLQYLLRPWALVCWTPADEDVIGPQLVVAAAGDDEYFSPVPYRADRVPLAAFIDDDLLALLGLDEDYPAPLGRLSYPYTPPTLDTDEFIPPPVIGVDDDSYSAATLGMAFRTVLFPFGTEKGGAAPLFGLDEEYWWQAFYRAFVAPLGAFLYDEDLGFFSLDEDFYLVFTYDPFYEPQQASQSDEELVPFFALDEDREWVSRRIAQFEAPVVFTDDEVLGQGLVEDEYWYVACYLPIALLTTLLYENEDVQFVPAPLGVDEDSWTPPTIMRYELGRPSDWQTWEESAAVPRPPIGPCAVTQRLSIS